MKTVVFETTRELTKALLDNRVFRSERYKCELTFSDKAGCIVKYNDGDIEYLKTDSWIGETLVELPIPRHHAEIIKTWTSDENIVIEFQHASKGWYETEPPQFHSSVTYRALLNGEVIMVSEAK